MGAPTLNPLGWGLVFIVGGVVSLWWIFIALDCLIRNFGHYGRITHKPKLDRFIWFVIILTLVGAVVYYFVVRRKAPHI